MKKYWLVFWMSLQDHLTYRVDMVLSMIKYAGVVMLMSYVWLAAGKNNPDFVYSQAETITYFVLAAALFSLSNFHTYYIEEDIRLGWLSKYLLKPISALNYYLAHEAAQAFLLTTIKLMVLIPLIHFFIIPLSFKIVPVLIFLLYLPLVFLFTFLLYSQISIGAFWIQEIYALRWASSIIFRFLAGAFAPLVFFPTWYQDISRWLPFQYLLYTPVQVVMEKITTSAALQGLGILTVWTIILFFIRKMTWQSAIKAYEGTGI